MSTNLLERLKINDFDDISLTRFAGSTGPELQVTIAYPDPVKVKQDNMFPWYFVCMNRDAVITVCRAMVQGFDIPEHLLYEVKS